MNESAIWRLGCITILNITTTISGVLRIWMHTVSGPMSMTMAGSGVLSQYDDWGPYRFGYWTWCSPYGWTWVGHEPWGWAPYHYGRWIYHDNYWAWCPHSQYYRQ